LKPFLDEQKWSQKVLFRGWTLKTCCKCLPFPPPSSFGKKGEVVSRMPGFLPDRFVDMLTERIDEGFGTAPLSYRKPRERSRNE